MHETAPHRINRMSIPSAASEPLVLSRDCRTTAMNLLLLGADGQLGRELRGALKPLGEVVALGAACDITDADAVRRAVRDAQPGAIVNAAAYTAVDAAETDAANAYA